MRKLALAAVAGLVAVGAVLLNLSTPAGAAGQEKWVAGKAYHGSFPDPSILVDGDHYVVAGTTVAQLNLPIQTSTDLTTWKPREPLGPGVMAPGEWKQYDEAMLKPPKWAATFGHRTGKMEPMHTRLISQWGPSLAKIGDTYLAAFSAATVVGDMQARRSCIGIATSPSAIGPYTPTSQKPLFCFKKSPKGVIGPDYFIDPKTNVPYLLWKQEGLKGIQGPELISRRLDPTGTHFARGSKPKLLMERGKGRRKYGAIISNWEGIVVENPSMVFYGGHYYLFYTGNQWSTSRYAIGYAVCRGPLGPCTKKTVNKPLLGTRGPIAGPGSADAFVDLQGNLRFVYAAWDAGHVADGSYGRPMHVATLKAVGTRLTVTKTGA